MEKIIVAIDGLNYKASATEYAIALAIHLHSHLVGIFLHDRTYHSYRIYDIDTGKLMTNEEIDKGEAEDVRLRKDAIQQFKDACNLRKIPYTIREDKDIALHALVHESLYADLLVINAGEQFNPFPVKRPSAFMKNLLETVECPIILAPDQFEPLHKAVLLYDGTPTSVYALKKFCDLMPRYANPIAVEVLAIKKDDESLHLKDNKLMKEYLKRHLPKAIFTVVKGEAHRKIPALLKKEGPGTLVVLGAYQRGVVSRWFRPSMADVLLSTVALPLFIAHSK